MTKIENLKEFKEFVKIFEDSIKEKNGKGLTFEEIVNGVKNGSIKIHHSHHNEVSIKAGKQDKQVIENLERQLKQRKKTLKALPDNLVSYLKVHDINEFGHIMYDSGDVYCWDCDSNLMPMLTDAHNLYLVSFSDLNRIREKKGKKIGSSPVGDRFEYVFKKEDIENLNCPLYKEGVSSDAMITEINVPSGKLLFKNYFNTKEIYENDDKKFSINSILGRYKLMKDLASKNVGYGQMGNMSINVFKKNDGTEIIIHNDYYYDGDKDIETTIEYDGFKNMGSISLSVWRWQCADVEVLKKVGEKVDYLPKNLKEGEYDKNYLDNILLDVKPGIWVIEHYYDMNPSDEHMYSKLYLKK
jgi:hypothetical protein